MTDFEAPESWRQLHSLDKNQALITQSLEGIVHRLDMQEKRMDAQAKDIDDLKARRWPAGATSLVAMIIGIGCFIFTLVKGF